VPVYNVYILHFKRQSDEAKSKLENSGVRVGDEKKTIGHWDPITTEVGGGTTTNGGPTTSLYSAPTSNFPL